MSTAHDTDIAKNMEGVARLLLGEPNARQSNKKELRFGSNGSVSVDLAKGTFFDHETGAGGGVLALVEREKGLQGKEAVEWLKGQGFHVEDRAPARVNGHAHPNAPRAGDGRPKREAEATYDYTDADGNLLFQVVRWVFKLPDGTYELTKDGSKKRKTFSQRRPAPGEKGVWINGLDDGEYMRRGPGADWYGFDADNFNAWGCKERARFDAGHDAVIYRLPEVLEAVAFETTVYVVEGEKKADLLWSWGVPATCNAGGSKKWRPDYAQYLRDADVVILPDNDEQARDRDGKLLINPDGSPRIAGRDHADKVVQSLTGVAARVRGLDLPGLPPKGDVVDWAAAGGTVEQLHKLTETRAKPWRKQAFVSRFGAVAFENIDQPGPEFEFLIDDWLSLGDKSVMGGPSRSGKSFLAIHAGLAVALPATPGLPAGVKLPDFFGHKVMAPGLVIYQAGEGSRGVKQRLRAFRKHFGVPASARVPFVLLQSKIDLYRPDGDTAALIEEIKGIADQYEVPLRAFFIDTLATATGGADENSGRDMSAVMDNVDRINRSFAGCHVCLVHHMNAAGTKLRGHTSIYANVDQVVMVNRDEGTKIRTAVLDKQKEGEDGKTIRFELQSLEVGIRKSDGKVLTSCVCVEVGEKEAANADADKGFKLTDQEDLVFRALTKAVRLKGRPAPAELTSARAGTEVVEYKYWREEFAKSAPIDSQDDRARTAAIKKAMQRAGTTLLKFGVIGRDDPWVWWTGKPVRGFGGGKSKAAGKPEQKSDLMTQDDEHAFSPF